MKKMYHKPEIMFEHLDMSQAIAICDYETVGTDQKTSTSEFDGPIKVDAGFSEPMIILNQNFMGCDKNFECYDVPTSKTTAVNLS